MQWGEEQQKCSGTSAFGLLIAVVLSTQGVAGPVNIGSQSTGAGAGKVTFNPFSVTRMSTNSSFAGAGRTVPWAATAPKAPGPPPTGHISVAGAPGTVFAPHCVAPLVAVAFCVRRGPGAHGRCEAMVWKCQLPGVADGNPARQ